MQLRQKVTSTLTPLRRHALSAGVPSSSQITRRAISCKCWYTVSLPLSQLRSPGVTVLILFLTRADARHADTSSRRVSSSAKWGSPRVREDEYMSRALLSLRFRVSPLVYVDIIKGVAASLICAAGIAGFHGRKSGQQSSEAVKTQGESSHRTATNLIPPYPPYWSGLCDSEMKLVLTPLARSTAYPECCTPDGSRTRHLQRCGQDIRPSGGSAVQQGSTDRIPHRQLPVPPVQDDAGPSHAD